MSVPSPLNIHISADVIQSGASVGGNVITACSSVAADTDPIVKLTMGGVVDYFRPRRSTQTLCEMLISNEEHEFSPSIVGTWVRPDFDTNQNGFLGGSQLNWPRDHVAGDNRAHLSAWGSNSDLKRGGCCTSANTELVDWGRPFTMEVLLRQDGT